MVEARKHVLSLFTKSPQPGVTKTRLTEKHGGALSEQEAADLYLATTLDVAEAAFQALELCRHESGDGNIKDEYSFFISFTPESESTRLKAIFEAEFPGVNDIHYMVDRGRNFDEHFNDHYRQLFDRGYHSVVCIGGDLPTISPEFIHRAFRWLSYLEEGSDRGAITLAPCQAAGVSLVGLTADAPMDFTGVFYNPQGISALEALISIATARQIPTAMLETQFDVDTMEDLAHIIAVISAMTYTSRFQPGIHMPRRTLDWIAKTGLVVQTPPNPEHDP
jgi:glycosyltransferase A (GT-A) superfamily protein (DUF2064 family)